jgi:hypothetical protein
MNKIPHTHIIYAIRTGDILTQLLNKKIFFIQKTLLRAHDVQGTDKSNLIKQNSQKSPSPWSYI